MQKSPVPLGDRGGWNRERCETHGADELYVPANVCAVKSHPFFAPIDWSLVGKKQLVPPFVPDVGEIAGDTRNFEDRFTNRIFGLD